MTFPEPPENVPSDAALAEVRSRLVADGVIPAPMPDQTPEPLTDDAGVLAPCCQYSHTRMTCETDCGNCNVCRFTARIASLESGRAIEQDALHAAIQTISRVTDLFEKWAAEESEHRAAGEYGLAEGLHVAIEELRMAVHGTYEEPYRD